VLEEAPAPGMTPGRRAAMGGAAVAAAKAIGYVGAGTVEFIADQSGTFHFMEMNTRLQVEHPVTEMITGQDLVEWQLRVARGEPLPLRQDALAIDGHALEARIYAEDPAKGFLPATGRIVHLGTPPASRHVRIDTGVAAGDEISPHYDPMIAKLIVWERDRPAALARMRAALEQFQVVGVTTNVAFLGRLVASKAFAGADLDTGLIERSRDELFPPPAPASDEVLAAATLAELARHDREAREHAAASGDPWSPWGACDGWRLNQDNHHVLVFREGEREVAVTAHYRRDGYEVELPGGRRMLSGETAGASGIRAWLDGEALAATVVRSGATIDVFHGAERHSLELHDPWLAGVEGDAHGGGLAAPMPGKVIAVLVAAGAAVERGAPLVIMEAMKMEHTITAPAAGTVKEILYAVGEQVAEGAELIRFDAT
jgi:3-methylcrotonyl-CoA carboxylase alpha subunit